MHRILLTFSQTLTNNPPIYVGIRCERRRLSRRQARFRLSLLPPHHPGAARTNRGRWLANLWRSRNGGWRLALAVFTALIDAMIAVALWAGDRMRRMHTPGPSSSAVLSSLGCCRKPPTPALSTRHIDRLTVTLYVRIYAASSNCTRDGGSPDAV